jgi:hypothetical protein
MSGFEEAEFGGRRVVPIAPVRSKEEVKGGQREGDEGGGGKAPKASRVGQGKNRKGKTGSPKRKPTKAKVKKHGGKAAERRKSAKVRTPDPGRAAGKEAPGVLVPLDQWTRVLNQLGNLHEAGHQIADARERAAKAETEAAFLRERLKEMRSELEVLKRTDLGGR